MTLDKFTLLVRERFSLGNDCTSEYSFLRDVSIDLTMKEIRFEKVQELIGKAFEIERRKEQSREECLIFSYTHDT